MALALQDAFQSVCTPSTKLRVAIFKASLPSVLDNPGKQYSRFIQLNRKKGKPRLANFEFLTRFLLSVLRSNKWQTEVYYAGIPW
jgi:hypothetical protein